jgi:rRNA processing protein Gar1
MEFFVFFLVTFTPTIFVFFKNSLITSASRCTTHFRAFNQKKKIGILNDVFPPHFQMFHSFLQSKKNEEKEEKKRKEFYQLGTALTHAPAKEQKKNISRLLFFLKKKDKILYL